jgi:ribose transport system ATP-binding protein
VELIGNPKGKTHSPNASLKSGMNLLSENRKEEGLAVSLGLTANLTLSRLKPYKRGPFLDLRKEQLSAQKWLGELGVKHHHPQQPATTLSGGNQQKVAIARMLHHDSRILLLDEPTRGIDVGSKAEIYKLIEDLAGQGKAIIVVSSYLPELMGICDSLAVMHKGRLSPKMSVSEWDETSVMRYATSGTMPSKELSN